MHDVLRQRILRKLETLPEEQMYQVLDYIEFLESKYARDLIKEASGLQKFAENLEDRLRKKAVNPANIREAFQLIAAADRVLSSVSQAGKELLDELSPGGEGEDPGGGSARSVSPSPGPGAVGSRPPGSAATGSSDLPPVGGGRARPAGRTSEPSGEQGGSVSGSGSGTETGVGSGGQEGPGNGGGAQP
jgi:hypothetical protein